MRAVLDGGADDLAARPRGVIDRSAPYSVRRRWRTLRIRGNPAPVVVGKIDARPHRAHVFLAIPDRSVQPVGVDRASRTRAAARRAANATALPYASGAGFAAPCLTSRGVRIGTLPARRWGRSWR